MSLAYALLVVILVILLHELGHWVVARWWGFNTPVLSVGFGFKLFKFFWRGTEFRLCLFPLGGYVEIPQLARAYVVHFAPSCPDLAMVRYNPATAADGSEVQPATAWQRITIAAAGPLVNLVIGAALIFAVLRFGTPIPATMDSPVVGFPVPLAIAYGTGTTDEIALGDYLKKVGSGPSSRVRELTEVTLTSDGPLLPAEFLRPQEKGSETVKFELRLAPAFGPGAVAPLPVIPYEPVFVQTVSGAPGSIAALAGLQPGDRWLRLAARRVAGPAELAWQLRKLAGKKVEALIERQGAELPVSFTVPMAPEATAALDSWLGFKVKTEMHRTMGGRLSGGTHNTVAGLLGELESSVGAAKPAPSAASEPSNGSLGLLSVLGESKTRGGWFGLLWAAAIINLALMIINLLPIPPLDGGRILEGLIELVTRRPLPAFITWWKDMFGLGFILTLLGTAFFSDAKTAGKSAMAAAASAPAAAVKVERDPVASAQLREELAWLRYADLALRTDGKEKTP